VEKRLSPGEREAVRSYFEKRRGFLHSFPLLLLSGFLMHPDLLSLKMTRTLEAYIGTLSSEDMRRMLSCTGYDEVFKV